MICCIPSATARRPEPHNWFNPQAVASCGHSGSHRRLARRVLALAGGEDLAEDDFVDVLRRNSGPLERSFDGDRAKVMGGNRRQCPIERTNRSASGTGDNDRTHDDIPVMF
jgi:hypothetical protein